MWGTPSKSAHGPANIASSQVPEKSKLIASAGPSDPSPSPPPPLQLLGGKEAYHFNPLYDFLQAFQSAIGKWNRPKDSPSKKAVPSSVAEEAPPFSDTLRFEHIELAQFSRLELDPSQTGVGHNFLATDLQNPTWCDLCGDFIWGLYKARNTLTCKNCKYTCHQRCRSLVTLNCKSQTTEFGNEFFEVDCAEDPESLLFTNEASGSELQQKIAEYNSTAQGYEMVLDDGDTFHGFIRVHMNLTRPINVLAGTRPPSIYDIIYEEEENLEKTLTSFYLPRDTVKALHITSRTTARELISALLKKFKVVDNPLKFCLYEKSWGCEGSAKGVLRRIQDHEKPLWLVLVWGNKNVWNRKLVLQENDTGDIMWEAFTFPELNNFLRILDREEEEYLNQVRLKYKALQDKMKEALERFETPTYSDVGEVEDIVTNM